MRYIENGDTVSFTINKTIGRYKLISRKIITPDIAFEETVNIVIAKILMKYRKNIRTNS